MKSTALLLAAHGAGDGSPANHAARELASAVRRRSIFSEVVVAFRMGQPSFATVLDSIRADDVVVVPLMTTAGHYVEKVVPRELARNRRFYDVRLQSKAPLGTLPALRAAVCGRIMALLEKRRLDARELAIVVAGHGTKRHPRSRHSALRLQQDLAAAVPDAETCSVFLDDTPAIEEAFELTSRPLLVVVPFLLGGGSHARHDLPTLLGLQPTECGLAEGPARGRWILCDQPIGHYPELADLIVQLALEPPQVAAPGSHPRLRVGTRPSQLAVRQAEIVASQLRREGHDADIVVIRTTGDRDLGRPIAALSGTAPFADDIEQALLGGDIDIAVHSLKDLPDTPTPGLTLAAVLPRAAAGEALVSCQQLSLRQLPARAVIGTSSERRAAQLLAVRPDLRAAPVRGPVDDRVRQVRDGRFDAAILAVAGLARLGLTSEITEDLALGEFLPAPGQGALAVQVRCRDASTLRVCAGLDDPITRRATAAELAFLRLSRSVAGVAAAAHATINGEVQLRGRLLALDGTRARDVIVRGAAPQTVANEAFELASRAPLPVARAVR